MRKILAVFVLLIAMMFSGCFPTGAKNADTSMDFTEDKTFKYKAPHINVSFEIPQIQGDLPPTRIKLKEKTFDTEEMINLFFSGKTIDEEETFPNFYWATDSSFLNMSPTENYLKFADGPTSYDGLGIKGDAPINYRITLEYSREHYREMYNIGEELELFSSRSAIDRALELCSTLGITHLGKPRIYAFDLDTYEKIREKNKTAWFSDEIPLTKDNEVYVLSFRQNFGGIELTAFENVLIDDSTAKTGKSVIFAPEVTIGVSKNDIFYLDVEAAYEPEYEVVSNDPIRYDLNYALSELTSYLKKAYFKDPTVINSSNIVYFPIERKEPGYVEYSLAWNFGGTVHDKTFDDMESYSIIFLAENGIRKDYNF